MEITRNSIETTPGPADWFTGEVYIDTVAAPSEPSRLQAATSASPRAPVRPGTAPERPDALRDRGHRPLPRRGGAIEVIRPGDRVFFEPGEDHWHGAAPDRFMTHLAMQEVDDQGSAVTWGDHVTDEEYRASA